MGMGVRRGYLPLVLYVIGLNTLIIAAVAVLHELGHATAGYLSGCNSIEIVLLNDGYAPHTEMVCAAGTEPGTFLMAASAFLFVLPLALLFHAQRGLKERFIGHIVLGVGIIAAAHDIQPLLGLGHSDLLIIAIGGVIALYGEDRLVHGIILTEMPPTRLADRQV